MNSIYVLDTNTIIHYLHHNPIVVQNFENAISAKNELIIPRIVDYEVRRGFEVKSAPNREIHYDEISRSMFCDVVNMGENFWHIAAQIYGSLYKQRFTVGDHDIIIGAFCIYNDYTLITANVKDFQNMDRIKLVDWTYPV